MTIIETKSGSQERRSVAQGTAAGLWTEEQLLRQIIDLVHSVPEQGGAGGDEAIRASHIDRYLASYIHEPYAGVYAEEKMRSEGKLNLHDLVRVYEGISDKNHPQYLYSTLGLANLLNDAGRPGDALMYLEHIKTQGVDTSRAAELYLAFGQAYYRLGQYSEALQYFITVRKMTDRYQSVSYYIKTILDKHKHIMGDISSALLPQNSTSESGIQAESSNVVLQAAATEMARPVASGPTGVGRNRISQLCIVVVAAVGALTIIVFQLIRRRRLHRRLM